MDDAFKRTGKYLQRPPMPDAKQRGQWRAARAMASSAGNGEQRGCREGEIAGQARNDKSSARNDKSSARNDKNRPQ